MRRKDRQKDEAFALEVIRDCEYGTLATTNQEYMPYCIPISPVLYHGAIYFHCATEGMKLDNIQRNPHVCFSCVRHTKRLPEVFSTEFESAVVFGTCEHVTDEIEKIGALRILCEKYAPSHMEGFEEAIARSLKVTTVMKIHINEITGKARIS